MPRDFLILCDTDGNQVKRITLEMLSKANALAQGGATNVVVLGDVDTSVLKSHGADKIYKVKVLILQQTIQVPYSPASNNSSLIQTKCCAWSCDTTRKRFSQGYLFEQVLDWEAMLDLVEVGDLVGIRPKFEGKVFCTVKINTGTKLFTVRPNLDIVSSDGAGEETIISVEADGVDGSYKVVGIEHPATIVDPTEADALLVVDVL